LVALQKAVYCIAGQLSDGLAHRLDDSFTDSAAQFRQVLPELAQAAARLACFE
jgi:hypothetical protein